MEILLEVADAGGQSVDVGGVMLSEQRIGEALPFSMAGGKLGKPMRVPLGRTFNEVKVGTFPIVWSFLGTSVATGEVVGEVIRVPLKLPCHLVPVDIQFHARGGGEGRIFHVRVNAPAEWNQWAGVRAQGGMRRVSPGETCRVWFPTGPVGLTVFRGDTSWNEQIDVAMGMEPVILEL